MEMFSETESNQFIINNIVSPKIYLDLSDSQVLVKYLKHLWLPLKNKYRILVFIK